MTSELGGSAAVLGCVAERLWNVTYWIAADSFAQEGQVQGSGVAHSAQIPFSGTSQITATYEANGTWPFA